MENTDEGTIPVHNDVLVPQEDKTLTQAQVNDIVKREKTRAAERVRQELEAKHQSELEQLKGASRPEAGVDVDRLKKELYDQFLDEIQDNYEQSQKEAQQRELKSLAETYNLKMGKGSQLFEDFNEVMADFEPDKFSNTAFLVAKMDNVPEIMYELASNPDKLVRIDMLAKQSPKMAAKELERLSQSIAKNLEAKANNVSAPPPLSRPKPSVAGVDNGKLTVRDLKTQPWLRG